MNMKDPESGTQGKMRSCKVDLSSLHHPFAGATSGVEEPVTKASFAGVVKTAMMVRDWVMSVQPKEEQLIYDRNSEINTSSVFEPPAAAAQTAGILESRQSRASLPAASNSDFSLSMAAKLKMFVKKFVNRSVLYFVIDPTSTSFYYWTTVVTIGCFYNMLMVVIFVFDDIQNFYFYQWLCSNIVFDFVFLVDILIRSRISYMHDGALVKDLRTLARRYWKSYTFWLDVLSLFPCDLALLLRRDLSLSRINRLLKSYRVLDFTERTEMRTNFPNGFRICVLITTCIVLFHWNACAYFFISLLSGTESEDTGVWMFTYTKIADPVVPTCEMLFLEGEPSECWFNETGRNVSLRSLYIDEMMTHWKNNIFILKFSNFSKEYSLSMYWSALTLTTKGQQPYPSSSIQNTLEVMDTLIGLLIFAVIIGSVGSVVSTMNRNHSEFQETLDGIKFYMTYRQVDPDIQKRVLSCCEYVHTQGITQDENSVLGILPARLQGQLAVHLHMDTLKHVELLQDCDPGLLYELVLRLQFHMFSPNDYLCRRGELAKEMFIVKRGQLNYVSDDGSAVLAVLTDGDVFGQLSIFNLSGNRNGNKYAVAVRSCGYTDVYVLRQEDVCEVLQDYPEARKMFIQKAKQMLTSDDMWVEEMADEEEDTWPMLTVEEQFQGLEGSISKIDSELSVLYDCFDDLAMTLKQRVTKLETTLKANNG